jgi:hypothetical protein
MSEGHQLNVAARENPTARLGWRFAVGVVLVVGGYAAWSLIPVAVATDLHPGAKSVITALLGVTPFMTKVAAIALMGRPAYDFFQAQRFEVSASPDKVTTSSMRLGRPAGLTSAEDAPPALPKSPYAGITAHRSVARTTRSRRPG